MQQSIYDFTVLDINNNEVKLSQFRNKALLIVNTASKCGFTKQYRDLEALYQKYQQAGLVVLAFPCNQFLSQEPGDSEAIKNFCSTNYSITFPLFAKIDVNGEHTHPLYKFLKSSARGVLFTQSIKWNFTKFLVSRNGLSIKRFSPTVKPLQLSPYIEKLI